MRARTHIVCSYIQVIAMTEFHVPILHITNASFIHVFNLILLLEHDMNYRFCFEDAST